ncbi:MAG: hypothetical protein R3E12_14310 [Candidatus Eisenbacteria bacterium]
MGCPEPLLYLSLFFKRHREEYYRRLAAVRSDGDWEGWTRYFLEAVATIATEAVASARALFALVNADRARVLGAETSSVSALRPFEALPSHPILSIARTVEILKPHGRRRRRRSPRWSSARSWSRRPGGNATVPTNTEATSIS